MKMIPSLILGIAGVACGFAIDRALVANAPKPEPQVVVDQAAVEGLAKAEKRIESLEKQLTSAKDDLKKAKDDAEKAKEEAAALAAAQEEKKAEEPVVVTTTGDGNVNVMDQLKKRLPAEQFEQVQDAFAQMRQKLAQRAKSRSDYLNSIDTSRMSEKERENHRRYLELFAKREEISQRMRAGQFNRQSMQDMAEVSRELGDVAKEERATLMRQVANELGYKGEDAEVITETIKNVYDCTNGSPLGGLNDMIESFGGMGALGGFGVRPNAQ